MLRAHNDSASRLRRMDMANPKEFALKHGLATAVAIPATIATNWYLETLSVAGIALVFVLYLALFNGLAVMLRRGKGGGPDES